MPFLIKLGQCIIVILVIQMNKIITKRKSSKHNISIFIAYLPLDQQLERKYKYSLKRKHKLIYSSTKASPETQLLIKSKDKNRSIDKSINSAKNKEKTKYNTKDNYVSINISSIKQIPSIKRPLSSRESKFPQMRKMSPTNHFYEQRKLSSIPYNFEKMVEDIPGINFKSHIAKDGQICITDDIRVGQNDYSSSRYSNKNNTGYEHFLQQKRINVEAILSRKCRNFGDLMHEYYKRLCIKPDSKIFVFDSQDSWIKKALIKRGWIENPNKESKAFHLIWSYKYPKSISYSEQYINHFPKSQKLTSKQGLHFTLKKYGLLFLQPLTYDLMSQKQDFEEKHSAIQFLSKISQVLDNFAFQQNPFQIEERDLFLEKTKMFLKSLENPEEDDLTQCIIKLIKCCISSIEGQTGQNSITFEPELIHLLNQKLDSLNQLGSFQEELIQIIRRLYTYLCEKFKVNYGEIGSKNLWILKSKNGSKGAGITLSNDKNDILKYREKLVQKYVENILLLKITRYHKFDIRLWVLLTGEKKIGIYYHREFYGRVCSEQYDLSEQNIKNRAIHLANYSINKEKYSMRKNVQDSILLPEQLFAEVGERYQLDYQAKFYRDVQAMLHYLQPAIQGELEMDHSSNYFQLLGFDLLIDQHLHLHLLEINLSARCQQRHPKLSSMLQDMGEGLLNIIERKQGMMGWNKIH